MRRALRKIRKQRGYKTSDMADFLGVTRRTYRSYETGERNPSYPVLLKLEDLFGLPQRVLLEVEGESKAS